MNVRYNGHAYTMIIEVLVFIIKEILFGQKMEMTVKLQNQFLLPFLTHAGMVDKFRLFTFYRYTADNVETTPGRSAV